MKTIQPSTTTTRTRILAGSIAALLAAQSASADTLNSSVDLRLKSNDPNGLGDTGYLALYNNGGDNVQRTFLNFNLGSYSGNSVTTDAALTLRGDASYGGNLTGVSLGTANSAWTQATMTWNNQPGLTAISGATDPNGNFGSGDVTWNIPWYMLEKLATVGSGYNNGLGITSGAGSSLHFQSTLGNGPAPTLTFSAATAASSTWTGGDGNWTDTANWAGTTMAQGIAQAATINGGTAVNITMDANRSVGSLSFSGADHTISSGSGKLALNVTSGAPTISVETGRTATISATVVGVDGLTKSSAGALTLSGANTYTGATTISAGSLQLGNGGTTGSLSSASASAITNNGNLTINRSNAVTQGTDFSAAAISGNGSFTQAGAGTTTLTAANTYTGATTISAGTLKLKASVVAPPVAGYAQWFDASTISGSNGASISTWTNGGTGSSATVPSGNSAPTLLSDAGTGTGLSALHFNAGTGANDSQALNFTRDTNVRTVFSIFKGSSFLMTDSSNYSLHRPNDSNPAAPLLQSYGQINYLGAVYVNGSVVNPTSDAMPTSLHNGYNLVSIMTNGNAVSLNGFNKDRTSHAGDQSQAEVVIYDSVLTDAQRLTVEAYLNAKWFGIGSNVGGSLSSASPVTIASGAAFDLNGNTQQIASLTGASGASLTNSGITDSILTISGTSNTDFGGVISNGATNKISLVKSGASIQTLSGANTYTGGTTINAGTLNVNADAALGNSAGAVGISNGATLQAAGTVTTAARTLTLGAGGGVIDTNGNTVNFNSGSTVTGTTLTKTGAGTLNFGVSSGLTGLGALVANNGTTNVNSALGSGSSAVSVTGATTLKFGSVSQTLNSLTIGAGSTVTFTSGLASFSGGSGGKAPGFGGGTAAVPEPGTLGLLLVGALGVLNRRRRQP